MSSSTNASQSPTIAIIGGGLGGLSLLLTLHRRGIPATLYERDADASARAHLGGTLDLGWTSGQRALRENGLEDEFAKHSRPEGEEMKMYDASGKLLLHFGSDSEQGGPPPPGPEDTRPEIDRTVLRKILLDACPSDNIKWGHAFVSARSLGDGQHEVSFANGTTIVCDLLVGADGAHSRVRPLVSSAQPSFTGVTGVEISLSPSVLALPELRDVDESVGQGTMFAMKDNKLLTSQYNASGRIRTYVLFRGPEDWTVPAEPAAARQVLLEMFEGWQPWMLKLIEYCDPEAIYPRPMSILPVGHKWAHVDGVTLLGDAAHLMTPFAGAGANLAMLDALELGIALANSIKDGRGDREEAVKVSEEKMLEMAGRISAESLANLNAFVNPDSPQTAVECLQRAMEQGEGREG